MLKRYYQFITEAEQTEAIEQVADKSETDQSTDKRFTEIRDELRSMIEKTVEKNEDDVDDFVKKFLKNPKDTQIDGLISDSDHFQFFTKWKNDIDEILNSVKFFDESPRELNSIGVYKYIITATKKAIVEALKIK